MLRSLPTCSQFILLADLWFILAISHKKEDTLARNCGLLGRYLMIWFFFFLHFLESPNLTQIAFSSGFSVLGDAEAFLAELLEFRRSHISTSPPPFYFCCTIFHFHLWISLRIETSVSINHWSSLHILLGNNN